MIKEYIYGLIQIFNKSHTIILWYMHKISFPV